MRWSYNLERSQGVALWLFAVAFLVFAMVVVGGSTRLTGSGLSITEWKPLSGVIPPLNDAAWTAEFQNYQKIPQYQQVNRGMSLDAFKGIYFWEWSHRLLGRLIGVVFAVPFAIFLWRKQIPRRLIWRCLVILLLGGLQGVVGWWMVYSGLSQRIYVAPERLATHLGLALVVLIACVWTGLEAWFGRTRGAGDAGPRWRAGAVLLVGLVFLQSLLGALVAGTHAGRINTDWPLMAGRVIPEDYRVAGQGIWQTLAHNLAAVQFNHRLGAYLLLVLAIALALAARGAQRLPRPARGLFILTAVMVVLQAILGIVTLWSAAPLGLSILHQTGAVAVLTAAVCTAWRTYRA
jgi:cytochrome c oxidase assembly protein subunit 15